MFLLIFLFGRALAYSSIHTEPIIYPEVDLCAFGHTLCNKTLLQTPLCDNFRHIPLTEEKKSLILNGHNALRDRLAYIEKISNMIQLQWDSQLADMAYQWILHCEITKKDPWTNITKGNFLNPLLKYTQIHQNTAFIYSKFLPQYYELQIFRYWYIEKRMSKTDVVLAKWMEEREAAFFTQESNYSMIAWARLQRVGCALGHYHDGFAMVCNCFPF